MIGKKEFLEMKKEMEGYDQKREESIILSREVIKLSKRIIYATHREDYDDAKRLMSEMKDKRGKLRNLNYFDEGHFRTAQQEYAEAACFLGVVTEKKLPSRKELDLEAEHYLLGICDLSGELVRRAINSAIKKRYDESRWIRSFIGELYGEMLKFDFRNGDLRRKFDGIKYDLQKLDDLIFDIELKR